MKVELVKLDVPKALLVAASRSLFGEPPASTPQEHAAGRPWPQHVMTAAITRWAEVIGVLLEAAGFRAEHGAKEEPGQPPRPRRIGEAEWQTVKGIERTTGIEGVRILRAALQLSVQPPSIVSLLRSLLQSMDADDATKMSAVDEVLDELRTGAFNIWAMSHLPVALPSAASLPAPSRIVVYYLYGSKRDVLRRFVATFSSEQQLLAYVRWATLSGPEQGTTKFEQGSALAGTQASNTRPSR